MNDANDLDGARHLGGSGTTTTESRVAAASAALEQLAADNGGPYGKSKHPAWQKESAASDSSRGGGQAARTPSGSRRQTHGKPHRFGCSRCASKRQGIFFGSISEPSLRRNAMVDGFPGAA